MPTPVAYPRFIVAVRSKVVTVPSPKDGEDGLAVFWTETAAKKVALQTPGAALVIEATQEMFLEAIHRAHEMGVPWLYIGTDFDVSVNVQRVRLALLLGQYAFDGQHRHGEERHGYVD